MSEDTLLHDDDHEHYDAHYDCMHHNDDGEDTEQHYDEDNVKHLMHYLHIHMVKCDLEHQDAAALE